MSKFGKSAELIHIGGRSRCGTLIKLSDGSGYMLGQAISERIYSSCENA